MPIRSIAPVTVLVLALGGFARAQDAAAPAPVAPAPVAPAPVAPAPVAPAPVAPGPGAQGDALMASDSFLEAGAAYRVVFEETHDPTFLGKAAKAYMKLGPDGRTQALEAATLYTRLARTIDEAREAQAILAEAQAIPAPAPPPPPPAPAPVVITPPPAQTPPPAGPTDPANPPFWDALYLTDGSIVRGVIVSQNPREYAVALPGGSVVVVPVENVREIRQEPNRDYEPPLAESEAGEVKAESGFRFGAASGVALPVGDFRDAGMNASFEVAARVGWEFIVDQIGFSPAARVEYIRWANDGNGTYDFLHIGGDLRLAGHFGRVIPHMSVGAGGDLNYVEADDVFDAPGFADAASGKGFGLDVGAGLDILLTRRAALGFGVRFHPGFTDVLDLATHDFNPAFFAFQGGFAIY